MNHILLKELIDKYLDGTASDDERAKLEEWYDASDRKPGIAEFISDEKSKEIEERLYRSINEKIKVSSNKSTLKELEPQIKRFNYKPFMVAASVLLLAGIFLFDFYKEKTKVKDVEWVEIKAGRSAMKNVILADGSSVWINAGSSIRFQKNVPLQKREIWLQGEAFFDVVHDAKRPFEVHSGTITTHVLGTAFNIEAYAEDQRMAVSVVRGKVSVGTKKADLAVLLPNDQLTFNKKSSRFSVEKVEGASVSSWTTGKLKFKNEKFIQIAAKLERWYNVKVKFSESGLGDCRLTASFDTDVPVENVLKMLCKVSGNKSVKKIGPSEFLIKGKPCVNK